MSFDAATSSSVRMTWAQPLSWRWSSWHSTSSQGPSSWPCAIPSRGRPGWTAASRNLCLSEAVGKPRFSHPHVSPAPAAGALSLVRGVFNRHRAAPLGTRHTPRDTHRWPPLGSPPTTRPMWPDRSCAPQTRRVAAEAPTSCTSGHARSTTHAPREPVCGRSAVMSWSAPRSVARELRCTAAARKPAHTAMRTLLTLRRLLHTAKQI